MDKDKGRVKLITDDLKDSLSKEDGIAWAEALESGVFNQGGQILYNRSSGKYCCLGVLGKIQGKMRYELIDSDIETAFIILNDELKYSFYDIAQVVRKAYGDVL